MKPEEREARVLAIETRLAAIEARLAALEARRAASATWSVPQPPFTQGGVHHPTVNKGWRG